MKKVLSTILLFVMLITGITYWIILKNGTEKFEILNDDVSINNVKSILNIESENDDDTIEIPLGYKDGKIYLLKYDYIGENGSYERDIYTLNEDGTTDKTGMQIPDYYTVENINSYGEKIFCRNSCFDWVTGEYTTLFDDDGSDNIFCMPVSGNNNYFLFIKNKGEEKKYILCNIENKKYYKFNNKNNIQEIFYDDESDNFYCIDNDYLIQKVNLDNDEFTLEQYDELDFIDKSEENESLNYVFCNKGRVYIGQGFEYGLENYKNRKNNEFKVNSYSISNKESEKMNNINVCEYDRYYNDCVVVKRNEDESISKLYFAKLKNNGPDIIMELPKDYGNESIITIHMSESGNVLIKETYYNKDNKKIKNKYSVYDLKEYFTDNEYVLNDDGTWTGKEDQNATLKYTFKNIDDSQQNNKEESNKEENRQNVMQENTQPMGRDNDNERPQTPKATAPANSAADDDFREHDPSWRKEWYYYDKDNNKVTGWVKYGDGWYYFDNDGVMQKNAIVIEHGSEFVLDDDGKLVNSDNNTKYLENNKKDNKKNSDNLLEEDSDEYDSDSDKYANEKENKNEKADNKENDQKSSDLNNNEKDN